MPHNSLVIGRRRFLAASATLPLAARCLGQGEAPANGLRLSFRTELVPELPPPLEPRPNARVEVEFQGTGASARCSLGLQVTLDERPHLLPLAIWTADRQAYWRMREALRLPAFRGDVKRSDNGWSLELSGQEAFSARALPGAGAHGSAEGLPWISYRHQLAPSWADGPLDAQAVELWRLRASSAAAGAAASPAETSGQLGGWLARLGASGPASAVTLPAQGGRSQEFVRQVPAAAFEPFALRNYPRGALGLPEIDTQFCGSADLQSYRNQSRLRLAGVLVVAVDCVANPRLIERLVPPPCVADPDALVRVMNIRGLQDPALDEAWLLARCRVHGQDAWYAISHVKSSLAGSEYGREAWGYPTKGGAANALLGANRFTASVTRGNRGLYRAEGAYGGFSTGTSLGEMRVATLRPKAGAGSGPPAGEILLQPWYYQGLRRPLRRERLQASFPAPEAGSDAGAWNRMGPVGAYRADIYDDADLQRLPAVLAGEVPDLEPYYRDRCDGQLPWNPRPADGGTSD